MKTIKCIISLAVGILLSTTSMCQTVQSQERMDPVKILNDASQRFESLNTYTCKVTSIYNTYNNNKANRHQDIVQYVFQKPMSIRMQWVKPWNIKGQEAVYVDNKLKVRLNWLPIWVSINPDGNIAKDSAGNRIYQSDMGTVIKQIMDIIPTTKVVFEGMVKKNKQELIKISLKNKDEIVNVLIDKNLMLPVTVEYFGSDMKLIQAAYFENLEVDVPIPDYSFSAD